MSRPNELTGIIGYKGVGKSPLVVGLPEFGVRSLAQIYIKKKMCAFVLDTFDHPAYRGHVTELVPGTNLKTLKPGFYRIIANKTGMENVFRLFRDQLWNAAVFCEDTHKYITEYTPLPVMDCISDMKQKNIEMYTMYHSVDLMPRGLIMMADNFEIFKQPDPAGRKKELSACYDRYRATWQRVMAHPSKYYHETVNLHI